MDIMMQLYDQEEIRRVHDMRIERFCCGIAAEMAVLSQIYLK